MSFVLGKGFVDIDLDTKKFQGGLKGVNRRLESLKGKLQGAASFARRFLAVSAAGAGVSIGLAARQEAAEARLGGVLKTTGEAAGKSKDELLLMAAALQELTGFGDDAILNMQAILLTFKQIKGDNFDRATKAALDLSSVMQTDLKSAALQLGKALEDPTKGMTAMTRSGVSFSEEQKEVIKQLQASGKLFEAQVKILEAVEGQVSGVAEEINKGLTGALRRLKNDLGDTAEEFGKTFLPVLVAMNAWMKKILPPIRDWIKENPKLTLTLFGVATGVAAVVAILPALIVLVAALSKALLFLAANPIVLAAAGIAALIVALSLIAIVLVRSAQTGDSLSDTLSDIGDTAVWVAKNIATLTGEFKNLAKGMSGVAGEKIGAAIVGAGELTNNRDLLNFGVAVRDAGKDLQEEASDAIAAAVSDAKAKREQKDKDGSAGGTGGPSAPKVPPIAQNLEAVKNSFAATSDVFKRLSSTSSRRKEEAQRDKTNEILESINTSSKKTVKELEKGLTARYS